MDAKPKLSSWIAVLSTLVALLLLIALFVHAAPERQTRRSGVSIHENAKRVLVVRTKSVAWIDDDSAVRNEFDLVNKSSVSIQSVKLKCLLKEHGQTSTIKTAATSCGPLVPGAAHRLAIDYRDLKQAGAPIVWSFVAIESVTFTDDSGNDVIDNNPTNWRIRYAGLPISGKAEPTIRTIKGRLDVLD